MGTRCIYIDQPPLQDIISCWLAGDLSTDEYQTNFPVGGEVIDVFQVDSRGQFCIVAKSDKFADDGTDKFVLKFTRQEPR